MSTTYVDVSLRIRVEKLEEENKILKEAIETLYQKLNNLYELLNEEEPQ